MAKKKFSISSDLAKGIRNTINTASQNRGQLNYDMMSIDVIEPDPENPRKLELTVNDVRIKLNPSDLRSETKKVEYENLIPLVDSIKRVGVRNAIEVYKNGEKYRIISGERRLLATILAGKTHIPVHICEKPNDFNLKYLQWIENIQREDLTLWEKHQNLKQLVDNYQGNTKEKIDAELLSRLLGISTRQAYRYYNLLSAENDILDIIKAKKLNNLKAFNEIIQLKDPNLRKEMIRRLDLGEGTNHLLQEIKSSPKVQMKHHKMKSQKRGRPTKKINLGSVKNPHVAKRLIEIITSHETLKEHSNKFEKIDCDSPKGINQAFNTILAILEKQIQVKD